MGRSHLAFDISVHQAVLQSDGSYLLKAGTRVWYNELGNVHREDGPAVIGCPKIFGVQWCWNGESIMFNDWCDFAGVSDEYKMLLRLQYG